MPNRLLQEKSPYLLQHAHNPVDWYPWSDEAFARARSEDRPVFLSIGYSTCHWCHVMAHESFESPRIADILNRWFVPVKVDREELPDVDRVYMTALQSIGEQGGWPLSMFLTPDREPFFGGTYFPPETRYGRIGFDELLNRVHEAWTNDRANVLASAGNLAHHLRDLPSARAGGTLPGLEVLSAGFDAFARAFDGKNGGFGGAPKFPRPSVFGFLLRAGRRLSRPDGLEMTALTLRRMAEGGVYDHLGGGFHRYAVDARWRVPHFEKMLYDQAQIAVTAVDTFRLTGDPVYRQITESVLGYVLREMTGPDGEFYSAEDADSVRHDAPGESGEGAFYVWTMKEILRHLGEPAGSAFCRRYGVRPEGNVEHDPQNEFTGRNILYRTERGGPDDPGDAASRQALLGVRTLRPRPMRDDKVICAWNGLMITACARAGSALDRPDFIAAAASAARFVLYHHRAGEDNRLRRRWRQGEARFSAQLDDYAFLVQGILDLYEATGDTPWLRESLALTQAQTRLFRDEKSGALYDAPADDAALLVRTRELYDGAEPSGSSIAAMNLLRLSHMTGNPRFREEAEGILASAADLLSRAPDAMPSMMAALDFLHGPAQEIVILGRREEMGTSALMREVRKRYLPNAVVLLSDPDDGALAEIAPFVAALRPPGTGPAAFVCVDRACRLPVTEPAALAGMLDEISGAVKS